MGATVDELSLEALLLSRTYLYTLFHKLFGGTPTRELVDELLGEATDDAAGEYAADDETLRGLGGFLAELRAKDRESLLDAVRDEYTRALVGPAMLPAEPYASVNITHDPAVFQEGTVRVREAYRKAGWVPRALLRVPDDHVSLLCDFAAKRAENSLAAFREGRFVEFSHGLRAHKAFSDAYLSSWLPSYAKALRYSKTAVLYPQLAESLAAFVRVDGVFMDEAAYWAECRAANDVGAAFGDGAGAAADGDVGCSGVGDAVFERPSSFDEMDGAIARLRAVRLLGLEENELEPVA